MMKRTPATRADCPSADALVALVRREGAEAARLETLDHTMACPACREEFELLRAIDAGQRHTSGPKVHALRWQRPLTLALAASLVLAVGLGPGRDWLTNRDVDTMRSGSVGVIALLPEAGASIASDSIEFAWRRVDGAARYRVELLAPGGTVALTGATADTTLALAIPSTLTPGDYRWWVRAELPAGEQRSDARAIRLRRD
jgi:hypothetical protein